MLIVDVSRLLSCVLLLQSLGIAGVGLRCSLSLEQRLIQEPVLFLDHRSLNNVDRERILGVVDIS